MIRNVAIIGAGQIGTSIALALAKTRGDLNINISDLDACTPDLVGARFNELNISPARLHFAASASEAASKSDLVILATPLNVMGQVVRDIKHTMPKDAILTDTSSAKQQAITTITEALEGSGVNYAPAHPGNGTQGSGPLTGSPDIILSPNSWMFIIEDQHPTPSQKSASETVKMFWEQAGAKVATTDPQTHDKFFGTCSHLQHAIAFSLLHASASIQNGTQALRQSGTSFRNLTRVAMGHIRDDRTSALADMWQPIFQQNRAPIIESCEGFLSYLHELVNAVREGDRKKAACLLDTSNALRSDISDTEPRESITGEIGDIQKATSFLCKDTGRCLISPQELRTEFGRTAFDDYYANLMLPIVIAHAQTMNAAALAHDIVQDKANPSFRDGTAASLFDPAYAAHILVEHKNTTIRYTDRFCEELSKLIGMIRNDDRDAIKAYIIDAQSIRNEMPGPRKNGDVRREYILRRSMG